MKMRRIVGIVWVLAGLAVFFVHFGQPEAERGTAMLVIGATLVALGAALVRRSTRT